jgi:hypothetical protein
MSEGQLEFHLKLAVDPADHELIDFLRGLANEGLATRIEGDGDDLITVEVLEVSHAPERRGVTAEELLGKPEHHHESWQLQESANGGLYCVACGGSPEQDNEDDFTNPNGV